MTDEKFTCDECGRSFDSQRGLSIHQTQSHSEEKEAESEETSSDNQESISISVNHAIIGVFILGLTVGFAGGIVASGFQGLNFENSESTLSVMKDIGNDIGVDSDELGSCISSANTEEIDNDKSEIRNAVGSIGTPTFFIGNSEIGYTQVSGAQPYDRMKSLIESKLQDAQTGNTTISEDEHTLENISFDGEPVLGNDSAPINVIEYSDYGCPWCAEWHGVDAIPQRDIDQVNSFSQLRSNHVETGEVQFVAKDYPVSNLHPSAPTAHKAANCVLENSPDKFWEFSQKVYEERDRW